MHFPAKPEFSQQKPKVSHCGRCFSCVLESQFSGFLMYYIYRIGCQLKMNIWLEMKYRGILTQSFSA